MSNPQKEDGYTAIANEIMEALIRYRIPGEQRQCLDFILRKTYGFNKKSDMISNSQFVKATGLKKQAVSRALNGLILKNVIKKDDRYIPSYEFNKNYTLWKVSSKKITVNKNDYNLSSKKSPTKDIKKTYSSDSIEIRLSSYLFKYIQRNNPKAKPPNLQTWARHIDRSMRIDKRTKGELQKIIKWCQEDKFWQSNILSTEKLRAKFDQLWLRMEGVEEAGPKYERVPGT